MSDTQTRPLTFDHLKSKKKPMRREVIIPFDDAPIEDYETARDDYDRAVLIKEPSEKIQALREAMNTALETLKENCAVLVFESMGRKKFNALIEEHPPSDKQMEEWRKEAFDVPTLEEIAAAQKVGKPIPTPKKKDTAPPEPEYNDETFPRALIAASCIRPKMTEEQVKTLEEDWNAEEILEMWVAALEVNTQRRVASWGKG